MKYLHFDKLDTTFLNHVNGIIERKSESSSLFHSTLHPNGILGLSQPRELRLALATVNLLDTLDEGGEDGRLLALQAMHDEVLVSARTTLRNNTGRVLIQIMKDIVRAYGNREHQLMLAHDFCQAATGKPRIVRRLLHRYKLLEMPEEWNQLVFDHHVHDANTKGRKNPTHLIMDAWIKGIRELTVIYYNYVTPQAARELLTSAKIMGIKVKIGILFSLHYNKKFVDFIWVPQGFSDVDSFVSFLHETPMKALLEEAQKASKWTKNNILLTLKVWNNKGRKDLEKKFSFNLPEIVHEEFLSFVHTGQVSTVHLSEFIYKKIFPILQESADILLQQLREHNPESIEYKNLIERVQELDNITSEYIAIILDGYGSFNLYTEENLPAILKLPPLVLLDWLSSLRSQNEVILNLACLDPEDVLNIVWDCQGLITHLELFNLKNWQEGVSPYLEKITSLQGVINSGNIPQLKQYVRKLIRQNSKEAEIYCSPVGKKEDDIFWVEYEQRKNKLDHILHHTPAFYDMYKTTKLRSCIGTASTSRAGRRFGMGLAYAQTLPARARKELCKPSSSYIRIPLHTALQEQISYRTPHLKEQTSFLTKFIRAIPGFERFGLEKTREWILEEGLTKVYNNGKLSREPKDFPVDKGNIVSLGEVGQSLTNGFMDQKSTESHDSKLNMLYLNTGIFNTLKVLVGFIPAIIAFYITQGSGSILALIGAPLWFLITGVRNILQAVYGAGGWQRSPLLHWNTYVNWSRLCDSLMYTGLSVVLLELIIRYFFLGTVLQINAEIAPLFTFTCMSLVNGIYIASHNYFRGLQKEVIIGNIFRSFLAIPIALLYNELLIIFFVGIGIENGAIILISSAAIISKMASDTIAGLIEGSAERKSNIHLRQWDYSTKDIAVTHSFFKLEIAFPEKDALELLGKPSELVELLEKNNKPLLLEFITHALDYMYFYYYQPRARTVLKKKMLSTLPLEWLALYRMQCILTQEKAILQIFLDGLVGDDVNRSISFYLKQYKPYIKEMKQLCLPKKK